MTTANNIASIKLPEDMYSELFRAVIGNDVNRALRILGKLLDDDVRRIERWR